MKATTRQADAPRYSRPRPISSATAAVTSDKAQVLKRVAAASVAFEAARDALHHTVRLALDEGASWSEIGAVRGVSRQAAFQRFGPKQTRDEGQISEQ